MVRLEREAWDRLAGITNYAYNCCHLVSITDAEGQTTAYEYNDLGQQTKETYPDRTPGSTSWTLTYGIVEFAYDPAERMFRKTDQLGDTVTMNFNLASQMTRRDYRTKANSPSGTIADSDTFSFDRSGRMLTGVSGRYTNTVTNVFDALGQGAQAADAFHSVYLTFGQSTLRDNALAREVQVRTALGQSAQVCALNATLAREFSCTRFGRAALEPARACGALSPSEVVRCRDQRHRPDRHSRETPPNDSGIE